jgi:hypothetical protein
VTRAVAGAIPGMLQRLLAQQALLSAPMESRL